ncbi:hypothetical protein [Synechococcus sp. CCY9202]|nr:hypothetical protein [Synechococcus sp. CCY9202]MEA5424346.1 hypothetical protein [Synechococcus sp. CCY9202]
MRGGTLWAQALALATLTRMELRKLAQSRGISNVAGAPAWLRPD